MASPPSEIGSRCRALHDVLLATRPGEHPDAATLSRVLETAQEARKADASDLCLPLLECLLRLAPENHDAWQLLGFAYGDEQRIADAAAAFARAAALKPEDAHSAFALAQASLDAGLPAADLFVRAGHLAPADLATVSGRAAALAAEGAADAAAELLERTLAHHPDWLLGHKHLAALRWTSGDLQDFARSYTVACRTQPTNLPLRLAWFGALAQARDWSAARAVIADAEAALGELPAFAVAKAYLATESGNLPDADTCFARTAGVRDDMLQIARVRHCLRTARLDEAETLARELVPGRSAPLIWPYLSLIWRLRGDPMAAWLDGAPPFIRALDPGFSTDELDRLAAVLRRLQTARSPYLDQSVRGGTQTETDRQLFFRAEPEIQAARKKILASVREYVAQLPPAVNGHPLLGTTRGGLKFSGSWSVQLSAQGHHVSHTHPRGWISSALYISLPPAGKIGKPPAGWIRFGVPPTGLGVDLPAYLEVEPRPGRLVLFPSTMWHDTVPFDDGERLVVAFDVISTGPQRPR